MENEVHHLCIKTFSQPEHYVFLDSVTSVRTPVKIRPLIKVLIWAIKYMEIFVAFVI